MKSRLQQTLINLIILLLVACPCPIKVATNSVSMMYPVKPKNLKEICLDISKRLDALGYLSVSPEKFATFLWNVSYCESGHKVKSKGKDGAGSLGLWQMTADTRKKLRVKHGCINTQAENYFKFLKAGGKKLRRIKTSVDLHCYNFAPARFTQDTLSQVTNDGLRALDFNKDSIITKEDIILFQKKRLKV